MGFQKIKQRLREKKIYLIYSKILKILYTLPFGRANKNIIQLAGTTCANRHPDLFLFCQDLLKKESGINILSFGCSTGEECHGLREYFPDAHIFGFDINKRSIRTATKKNTDPLIYFTADFEDDKIRQKKFDLIFALSVLCKEPEGRSLKDISNIFPFSVYESVVMQFDLLLKTSGFIIIRNSNYRFEDSGIAGKYTALLDTKSAFPVFNKHGIRMEDSKTVKEVFRKNE